MRVLAMIVTAALLLGGAAPSAAQTGADRAPTTTAAPSGTNPTAQAVSEQELLRELGRLQGRITIPDPQAAILEQPQGRSYQFFHEYVLPWIMGILIIAMLGALALFYFTRGRVGSDDSSESGVKIQRFNLFERLTHWTTATSFIILALTGMNYVFGKRVIFPLIGPDAFATWSQWAKFTHTAIAWPFMLGVLLMLVMWVRDNIPDRYDGRWLREFGGFLSGTNPPAARFNAGQKGIFWSVVIFGIALSVSGVMMLFPFWTLGVNGMQWAQYVHAIAASILIAIMIAHVYIGTLGMRGAYDAMGSGEVDLAWAREHHRIWAEQQQSIQSRGRPPGAAGVPAE